MPDVVVTVPMSFGLDTWIREGDPAGTPWSGQEWDFYLGGVRPHIKRGEWVYVVAFGALRGRAPLWDIRDDPYERWRYSLVRHGGAEAVTIREYIQGFRGWRYRWWNYEDEEPFPNWQDPNACIGFERPQKKATTPHQRKPARARDGGLWRGYQENEIEWSGDLFGW